MFTLPRFFNFIVYKENSNSIKSKGYYLDHNGFPPLESCFPNCLGFSSLQIPSPKVLDTSAFFPNLIQT